MGFLFVWLLIVTFDDRATLSVYITEKACREALVNMPLQKGSASCIRAEVNGSGEYRLITVHKEGMSNARSPFPR